MSVLTALGNLLRDQLGYLQDVHFMRLDGGVSMVGRPRPHSVFGSIRLCVLKQLSTDRCVSVMWLVCNACGAPCLGSVAQPVHAAC